MSVQQQIRSLATRSDPSAFVKAIGNYAAQRRKIRDFLIGFEEELDESGLTAGLSQASQATNVSTQQSQGGRGKRGKQAVPRRKGNKYRSCIEAIANGGRNVLEISVDDILTFFGHSKGTYVYNPSEVDKGADVINTVLSNTERSLRLFYEEVESIRLELFPPQRGSVKELEAEVHERILAAVKLPVSFRVRYEIRFLPPVKQKPIAIHELRACHVGGLTKVEGIVSKVSSVKPSVAVAVYRCEECGAFEFQHVDGPTFTPLSVCQSQACKAARRTDTLVMSVRDSRFVKRQEARVQELPHLVPPGTVPRQLKVVLTGELTKIIRPGMTVSLGGIFLPVVEKGYRHPRASTASPTVLEVCHVGVHRSLFETEDLSSGAEIDQLISQTPDLYSRMAASIAPAIHGHEDVKKALLLQLVGGATETFGDGLRIRGDIHILLMGDPGIAKSQLLLRVCSVAPRAHFTCGKGASGVGLTASVVKDPVTGEFTLEGGAIVLADNGICCVDEFDKMQEADRTAIHEVMEQQTVSISKAGLTATLNARTTILAAANPVFGRYDITKSAVTNIGLPAALLSRFDIVFLLLDEGGNYEKDLLMARYILKIHKDHKIDTIETGAGQIFKPFTSNEIRALIGRAKNHVPKLNEELAEAISDHYVQLRQTDRVDRGSADENTYTTPRTLFGILRMAQALARLRFSDAIEDCDFQEALRLVESSRKSINGARAAAAEDDVGHIGSRPRAQMMEILKSLHGTLRRRKVKWITFEEAVTRAKQENLEPGLVEETVDNLVGLGSMIWDGPTKKRFKFLDLDTIEE